MMDDAESALVHSIWQAYRFVITPAPEDKLESSDMGRQIQRAGRGISDSIWDSLVDTERLAPALGAKPVRLELAGERAKRKRADYTIVKDDKVLAYLEHETKLTEAYGELEKLLAASAPLKGVITYGNEKETQELAKDIRRRLQEHNDTAEWIIIAGLGDMKTPTHGSRTASLRTTRPRNSNIHEKDRKSLHLR